MTTITFRQPNGSEHVIEAEAGTSAMHAAIRHGITGIVGECGGAAMCATCHVHVEEGLEQIAAATELEDEMLDCTASPRTPTSRLSCQLIAGSIAEMTLRIPERQV